MQKYVITIMGDMKQPKTTKVIMWILIERAPLIASPQILKLLSV